MMMMVIMTKQLILPYLLPLIYVSLTIIYYCVLDILDSLEEDAEKFYQKQAYYTYKYTGHFLKSQGDYFLL